MAAGRESVRERDDCFAAIFIANCARQREREVTSEDPSQRMGEDSRPVIANWLHTFNTSHGDNQAIRQVKPSNTALSKKMRNTVVKLITVPKALQYRKQQ